MNRNPWELLIAFLLIAFSAVIYWLISQKQPVTPTSYAGIILGVLGFLLMLKTELVYTLRKKLRAFRWGRPSFWLKFHIITGLLGPFLILLHSGWKFQGVAGAAALLLLLVVLSGLIGRYIYTATPRTIEGGTLSESQLQSGIERLELQSEPLAQELGIQLPVEKIPTGWRAFLFRGFYRWRYGRRIRKLTYRVSRSQPQVTQKLRKILVQQYQLTLQARSLEVTRDLLAYWHVVHVPLGLTMFTLAVVHIGGSLYYSWRS
jgi:hypothetical protein